MSSLEPEIHFTRLRWALAPEEIVPLKLPVTEALSASKSSLLNVVDLSPLFAVYVRWRSKSFAYRWISHKLRVGEVLF